MLNNAGVMPLSPLEALKVDEWNRMIDVNIRGVLHGIAAGRGDAEAGFWSIYQYRFHRGMKYRQPRRLLCHQACGSGNLGGPAPGGRKRYTGHANIAGVTESELADSIPMIRPDRS